jgi:hypothetical protein
MIAGVDASAGAAQERAIDEVDASRFEGPCCIRVVLECLEEVSVCGGCIGGKSSAVGDHCLRVGRVDLVGEVGELGQLCGRCLGTARAGGHLESVVGGETGSTTVGS